MIWAGSEVDVFDTETQRFHETKAAPIKKLGKEAVIALQLGDDGAGFTSTKDHRHFGRPPDPLDAGDKRQFAIQHLLVKKEERAKGLVLSGGGDVEVKIEVAQKGGDLFFAHLLRVTLIVEEDETADPVDVHLFSANAVAFRAQVPADTIEEFGRGSAT